MGDISTEDITFLVHDIARWILLLVSWSLAATLSKLFIQYTKVYLFRGLHYGQWTFEES